MRAGPCWFKLVPSFSAVFFPQTNKSNNPIGVPGPKWMLSSDGERSSLHGGLCTCLLSVCGGQKSYMKLKSNECLRAVQRSWVLLTLNLRAGVPPESWHVSCVSSKQQVDDRLHLKHEKTKQRPWCYNNASQLSVTVFLKYGRTEKSNICCFSCGLMYSERHQWSGCVKLENNTADAVIFQQMALWIKLPQTRRVICLLWWHLESKSTQTALNRRK